MILSTVELFKSVSFCLLLKTDINKELLHTKLCTNYIKFTSTSKNYSIKFSMNNLLLFSSAL